LVVWNYPRSNASKNWKKKTPGLKRCMLI
jgi:hypothetical protein